MNKEKFSTILFGFFVGLLLIGAIFIAIKIYNNQKVNLPISSKTKEIPTTIPSITVTEKIKEVDLLILSPQEGATVSAKTVKIEGKTKPNENVLIINQTEEKVITADKQGSFNTNISLEEGENNIIVSALGKTETRTVIYLPEITQ